jgi:hypothetical protein
MKLTLGIIVVIETWPDNKREERSNKNILQRIKEVVLI